jgi:tetratricopeptide (TPR) repeat protein
VLCISCVCTIKYTRSTQYSRSLWYLCALHRSLQYQSDRGANSATCLTRLLTDRAAYAATVTQLLRISTHLIHAQTYIELGDLTAALSACEHVIQQHDAHDVQALAIQGEVLVALGRHDEAAAVLTLIESL